jgi:hypothetical protein
MMHAPVLRLLPTIAVILLAGCATTLPTFTESVRLTMQADAHQTFVLHVATAMEFRSVRELDPTVEKGPFKKDTHRYLKLALTDSGTVVAGGNGWIRLDFGRGILLTFNARGSDGVYVRMGNGHNRRRAV